MTSAPSWAADHARFVAALRRMRWAPPSWLVRAEGPPPGVYAHTFPPGAGHLGDLLPVLEASPAPYLTCRDGRGLLELAAVSPPIALPAVALRWTGTTGDVSGWTVYMPAGWVDVCDVAREAPYAQPDARLRVCVENRLLAQTPETLRELDTLAAVFVVGGPEAADVAAAAVVAGWLAGLPR